MEPFINDDVLLEILPRLPIKSLMAFKCVSKRWNELISDPAFLRIQSKNSHEIVGLSVLHLEPEPYFINYRPPPCPLRFLHLVENKNRLNLNFLPEKVAPIASSNGLICCRTYKDSLEFLYFLCDLTRREFIIIDTPLGDMSDEDDMVFGLASYPFGTSSNQAPSFKLVNIQLQKNKGYLYSFFIYSSDTCRWKRSITFRCFDRIREDMVIFTNGRLHWTTKNRFTEHHCLLTFDVENETLKLIPLPECKGVHRRFGESEGYLHYICRLSQKLHIWVLKDYCNPVWELKHILNLHSFSLQNQDLLGSDFDSIVRKLSRDKICLWSPLFVVLSYYNEIVVLIIHDVVLSYNFQTGRVIRHDGFKVPKKVKHIFPVVTQCQANLVPLQNYVGHDLVHREDRRRRTILPCKRPRE